MKVITIIFNLATIGEKKRVQKTTHSMVMPMPFLRYGIIFQIPQSFILTIILMNGFILKPMSSGRQITLALFGLGLMRIYSAKKQTSKQTQRRIQSGSHEIAFMVMANPTLF